MIAWYVEHNELVYAAMLVGFTLTAVFLGYFWYEVVKAEQTPARPKPLVNDGQVFDGEWPEYPGGTQ